MSVLHSSTINRMLFDELSMLLLFPSKNYYFIMGTKAVEVKPRNEFNHQQKPVPFFDAVKMLKSCHSFVLNGYLNRRYCQSFLTITWRRFEGELSPSPQSKTTRTSTTVAPLVPSKTLASR